MIMGWPDCRNARDLGGLSTVDGHTILPGALLRSDNHDRLTPSGIQAVRASGVRRILDLRWEWECAKYPSPFVADPLYPNLPLIAEADYSGGTLLETYRLIIDSSRQAITTAVQAIADAPPGGVLVHCHSGKDRTGILVAMTLVVAGVPAALVAADYALTDGSEPETILGTLAHLEDRYGGVAAYLLDGGVEPGRLEAVRGRLGFTHR
jgi:protein tyrosine/serine phosphatase